MLTDTAAAARESTESVHEQATEEAVESTDHQLIEPFQALREGTKDSEAFVGLLTENLEQGDG
jgi:hypothetical protein